MRMDRVKGVTAACGLAFMQTILLIDLIYLPLKLIFPESVMQPHHKYMKYTTLVVLVVLVFINLWYYEGKYYTLKERFSGESFRVLKTILVFIIILLPMVIFIAGLSML